MSDRRVRWALLILVGIQAVATALFGLGVVLGTSMWPFPGTTPMSGIFIASLAAAAAVPTGWVALFGRERALVGIGLDYVLIFSPFAVLTALRLDALGGSGMAFLAVCIGGAAIGAWMIVWGRRFTWHDPRPTPTTVRAAFGLFIVALLVAATLLITGQPNVLPWQITPDLSTLFGFAFLGAASYFAFGLLEPHWENAAGQLLAFLAYDLVLIIPFLTRLPTIAEEFRVGLILYLIVVVGSGLLAIWFLFLHRRTRFGADEVAAGG